MAAPCSHPLIPDYVIKKSRGKAIALMGVGVVFGEVFSMGVLFNLTKSMTFDNAFLIAGLFIIGLSAVYLSIIKDPDMKLLRKGIGEKMVDNNNFINKSNTSSFINQTMDETFERLGIC